MVGVFGARGTGKSHWTREQIKRAKPARLLMWDHKHDPGSASMGQGFTDLGAAIRAMREKRFAVRYMPDLGGDVEAQFDLFCQAAFMAGNLVMWVDELPEVTKAGRAPPYWKRCVNVGREYTGHDGKRRELTIYGSGQRPGEVDKSFMNNLDVLHTGRIGNASDARILADYLRVDYRELMDMPDRVWIERRAGDAAPVRGGGASGKPALQKKDLKGPAAPKGARLREPVLPK